MKKWLAAFVFRIARWIAAVALLFAVIFVVGFGIWWVTYTATSHAIEYAIDELFPPTPVDVVATVQSPGGDYDAVVYEHNCGATCPFATHVEIIVSGTSVDSGEGVLVWTEETHPETLGIRVEWIDEHTLSIGLASTGERAVTGETNVVTLDETDFEVVFD